MEHSDSDLTREIGRILEFARRHLGVASERALRNPALQTLVLHRLTRGMGMEDAVLGCLHREAANNREVADEFLSYFLVDLYRYAQQSLNPALSRYLDTGDLVQSVMGDVWPDWNRVKFDNKRKFGRYLGNRLNWKAAEKTRRLKAGTRREDLRVQHSPEDLGVQASGSSPESIAGLNEERKQLLVVLARLRDRERTLVRRHLSGDSITKIATDLDLAEDTTRKALNRALERAEALAREAFGRTADS